MILRNIRSAKYFSIIVDSTPDVAHVDQLAIVIRHMGKDGTPKESFLEFLPNTGHKSKEMFDAVCNFMEINELDINNCRGQSYDNASNMSGLYTGLQARMKDVNALIEFIPCSAHSLNLVGTNAAESCTEACTYFLLLQNLYNFFSASTSRWDILQNLVDEGSSTSSLKSLSITRWSARDDACQALKHRWQNVLDALQIISDDSTQKPSTRAEAKGLIVALNRLETSIMTEVWGFILDRLNASNKQLQKVDIDLSSVVGIYTSLVELLKTNRDNFEFFEEKGKKLSNTETYESENKRKRKRKMQCDETNENAAELTARDKFKIDTYLVIVDKLLAELNKRLEAYKDVYAKFKAVIEIEK